MIRLGSQGREDYKKGGKSDVCAMILVVGICWFQGWGYDGRIGDGSYLSVEYEIESVEFLTGENTCQSVELALIGISSLCLTKRPVKIHIDS